MKKASMRSFAVMRLPDVVSPGNTGENEPRSASLPRKILGTLGLVAAFGLWLLAPIAQAQSPSPFAVETNIKGVYAYTQPPAGFDPRTAPAAELELYGYPPRPAANAPADALTKWAMVANPTLQRIVPQLLKTNRYHGPAQILKLDATAGTATSPNWSGYVLSHTISTTSPAFNSVTGRWTVPTVKQAANTCTGGWDVSGEWVGIDGFNNSQLLQAGSEADAYCADAGYETSGGFYPWFEWLPESELLIVKSTSPLTLLPFNPGDYLSVTVTATAFSGGESKNGTVVFTDVTQSWQVSLAFSASSVGGTYVTGKNAEWIVERITVNGKYGTLPNYFADPWWDTVATNLSKTVLDPGSPGTGTTAYNVTMLDNSNKPVSFVDLFGADALWFFPEGSAVAP